MAVARGEPSLSVLCKDLSTSGLFRWELWNRQELYELFDVVRVAKAAETGEHLIIQASLLILQEQDMRRNRNLWTLLPKLLDMYISHVLAVSLPFIKIFMYLILVILKGEEQFEILLDPLTDYDDKSFNHVEPEYSGMGIRLCIQGYPSHSSYIAKVSWIRIEKMTDAKLRDRNFYPSKLADLTFRLGKVRSDAKRREKLLSILHRSGSKELNDLVQLLGNSTLSEAAANRS